MRRPGTHPVSLFPCCFRIRQLPAARYNPPCIYFAILMHSRGQHSGSLSELTKYQRNQQFPGDFQRDSHGVCQSGEPGPGEHRQTKIEKNSRSQRDSQGECQSGKPCPGEHRRRDLMKSRVSDRFSNRFARGVPGPGAWSRRRRQENINKIGVSEKFS